MTDSSRDHPRDRSLELVRLIGKVFHASLDLDTLLQTTARHLMTIVGAEGGSIWAMDEDTGHLHCAHVFGEGGTGSARLHLEPGEGIVGWVVRERRPALVVDAPADPRWRPEYDSVGHSRTCSLLAAPLIAGGKALGVIAINNKAGGLPFTEADLDLLSILSDHMALAFQNARLFERERRARELQSVLRTVGQHFHTTLELAELLPKVFRELKSVLHCEALSLWLADEDTRSIVCEQAQGGASGSIVGMRVPMGQGIVGYVGQTQEPILIEDAQNDPRLYRSIDASTGYVTRSLICAPMVRQGISIGVIQALNKTGDNGHFATEDLDLLVSLASSAALAIENARLYKDVQSSYDSTLDALAAALDLRDRESEGHSRRVVAYTVRLAQAYGLPEVDVEEIGRGALLHDVGKIGVPDAILHKPGPLDSDERTVMERHPHLGYEMLAGISYLRDEAEIVLAHQEKFDGSGYPRGLAGEAIPIGARLFAVADTYDAITSNRPYRQGKPHAAAAAEICRESGRQFDPRAVEAFLSVPEADWAQLREKVMQEVQTRRAQQTRAVYTNRRHADSVNR